MNATPLEAAVSYRLLADLLVVLHLGVVLFVIAGATLVVWRKWIAWIHLPVVAWVVFAECFQVLCPLTYLENWLRDRGGAGTYRGDFVAHYIMPVLYPDGLTARIQLMFGVMVFAINATLYAIAFRRRGNATFPQRDVVGAKEGTRTPLQQNGQTRSTGSGQARMSTPPV